MTHLLLSLPLSLLIICWQCLLSWTASWWYLLKLKYLWLNISDSGIAPFLLHVVGWSHSLDTASAHGEWSLLNIELLLQISRISLCLRKRRHCCREIWMLLSLRWICLIFCEGWVLRRQLDRRLLLLLILLRSEVMLVQVGSVVNAAWLTEKGLVVGLATHMVS